MSRSSLRSWSTQRLLLLGTVLVVASCGDSAAPLRPVQDLPADVSEVVDSTWSDFGTVFAGRIDCMAPVRLALVSDVAEGDAAYLAEDRLIVVEIPTSPGRFRESLVHELAHHLEATCDGQQRLRAEFLEAQGFAAGADWDRGDNWESTPSEHFAEVVVLLVTGGRLLHEDHIILSDTSVELVAAWAAET